MDKTLLNVKEICEYLGLGETKVRQILHEDNSFTLKIGNRLYAHTNLLDKHLERCAKYNIAL